MLKEALWDFCDDLVVQRSKKGDAQRGWGHVQLTEKPNLVFVWQHTGVRVAQRSSSSARFIYFNQKNLGIPQQIK